MARIRTIKPEFFTSEDVVSMSPLSRLFYVSLWCEADREGRLVWNVKTLKRRYLAADDCDVDFLANELIENELIEIYEVEGRMYAEILSFKNHQVINNREADSVLPSRVKVASTRVQGEGRKEGKGRKEGAASVDAPNVFSKPDEVSQEVWDAFVKQRKAKKAQITELVMREISKEADKAGWTLEKALQETVVRNWQSFKAEWVDKQKTVGGFQKPVGQTYEDIAKGFK